MLYSNKRKLSLCGWLQKNDASSYYSILRLQKFLFLYEAFSKASNDNPDFMRLRGYKRGPVFSSVWGDYTKDRSEFNAVALDTYQSGLVQIDEQRARRAKFIVSTLSENELSALIHKFHIWNSKASRIMAGEQQVELCEDDFNEMDVSMTRTLEEMYPDALINDSMVIPMGEKYFVFSNSDAKQLTKQHLDTLSALAEQDMLRNPIYVELNEKGGLCVD